MPGAVSLSTSSALAWASVRAFGNCVSRIFFSSAGASLGCASSCLCWAWRAVQRSPSSFAASTGFTGGLVALGAAQVLHRLQRIGLGLRGALFAPAPRPVSGVVGVATGPMNPAGYFEFSPAWAAATSALASVSRWLMASALSR